MRPNCRLPEMARIVHLANFFGPRTGGLRTTMLNLAREYRDLGHQMHLVVPGARDEEVDLDGVPTHQIASPTLPVSGGYRLILRRSRVRRILDQLQPQAVELSDRTTLLPIAKWAHSHGIPVTCIVHERIDGVLNAHAPLLPARPIADSLNRALVQRVDRIVATTEFAAAEFTRIEVPVLRVPLGVDSQFFHPDKAVRSWREGLRADLIMVMASRLSREKRPDFGIEVLRSSIAAGVRAHLVVLGDGPLRGRLQAASVGLPVTYLGFVGDREQLAMILASADVVLAPGPIETFGLAALEAMASGTPVVVNLSSALREVTGAGGGVALPLHAHAWAQAALRQAQDPQSGSRARQRALTFTWSSTAKGLLSASGLFPVPTSAVR